MASFNEHINQAKKNLAFLIDINSSKSRNWDWQVTVCFYTAVHLINSHLAQIGNLHYRTHEDVKNAINPTANNLSICKLPQDIYLAYVKLEGLSRRARYLCNENFDNKEVREFLTFDKHFAKAIKNLDKILAYFKTKYGVSFGNPVIYCAELNANSPLQIFKPNPTIALTSFS